MTRTSRLRRQLHVAEPGPGRHKPQESFSRGQSPGTSSSEVPSPDSADAADLDAALTGMSLLLRVTLRLMWSYDPPR
jgi:hypothetical protein